jgi:hypothetical protein
MMKKFTYSLSCILFLATAQISAQAIFTDAYATGITFVDFGGSVNALSIDNTTFQSGTSSIKIVVPAAGYTGGAFVAATNQNLSTYNAVSFWVKASAAKTLNVSGLGNNAATTVYSTELLNVPVTTTWTKIIIPIPDASKVTAEKGMFHFAEGSDEGAYTIWMDNIQYETLAAGVIGTATAAIATETIAKGIGDSFGPSGLTCTFPVNSVATKLNPSAGYFTYTSSAPTVATVSALGVGTALAAGTTNITAKLGAVNATGTLTVNVSAVTAPTVAAPTPTRLAANVISLFSNAYTDLAATDWFPNWGQTTVVSEVQIATNPTKKYANFNYQGVQFATPVNVTTMTHLHIDMWTPSMTSFKVFLINIAPLAQKEQEVVLTPTAAGWNSFDIPLTSYPTIVMTGIGQLKLESVPSGTTAYLDNIYFYKDVVAVTAPTVAAPTPTRPAASVISLFSNAYTDVAGTDWFPNWGQTTVVTEVQIATNPTKKYTNFNYQGVQFATPINASTMNYLHIDLWTPSMTSFKVFLINIAPLAQKEQEVVLTPALSGWNSFNIPLASYNTIVMTGIGQLKLESVPAGTTAYLDNLYFFKTGVGTNDLAFANDLFTATPSVSDASVSINLTEKVQGSTQITLTNIAGQSVYEKTLTANSNAQTINVSTKALAAGVYIIGVRTGKSFQSEKITVSH